MVYDKTKETISDDIYIISMVNSAVELKKDIGDTAVTVYQVDLESGTVYKNPSVADK